MEQSSIRCLRWLRVVAWSLPPATSTNIKNLGRRIVMHWCSEVVLVITLAAATEALAQLPTYGVGRTPSSDEIHAQDISVGPSGKELPPGRGSAKEGAAIFEKR